MELWTQWGRRGHELQWHWHPPPCVEQLVGEAAVARGAARVISLEIAREWGGQEEVWGHRKEGHVDTHSW